MNSELLTDLIARFIVLFTTMPVHECAHGLVAHWLGDDTAEKQGRLNLNPIRHLDPIGTLLILFTGFGWARPVPVNPSRFKPKVPRKAGMALTALAGPMANIVLSFILMLPFQFLLGGVYSDVRFAVVTLLSMMVSINVGLAVFNLLPIPPLDGYNILSFFLPSRAAGFFYRNQQFFALALFAVIMFPPLRFIIDTPMSILSGWIFDFLEFTTGFMRSLAHIWA